MGSKQSRPSSSNRTSFGGSTLEGQSSKCSPQKGNCSYPYNGRSTNAQTSTSSTPLSLFPRAEGFRTASEHEKNMIVQDILNEKDYYYLFGVTSEANVAAIRKQYQKLMRAVHVDRGGDTQASAKVNYAYSVLTDQKKRKAYDNDRATFLSSPLLYAKNTASAVGKKLSAPWVSHDVKDLHDLVQGDHVYWLMDWTRVPHHGIVTSIFECANGGLDVEIVDFGVGAGSSRPIREVPLADFLPEGKVLKRAEYGERWWDSAFKITCSYKETPDPIDLVVQRAQRLCMVGRMDYELLEQSCETVAFWCKTGKRVSGQADKFLRILGSMKVAQVVTDIAFIGTVIGAVALFEAGAIGVTTFEATLATLSAATPLFTGVSVVGGTMGLLFFTLKAKQFFERRRLRRKTQPTQLINLITKLTACDRRTIAPMLSHDFDDYVQGLVDCLDSMVVQGYIGAMHRPAEMAAKFKKSYENYMHDTGIYPGSADDSISFAIQVLVRCRSFNAFLDFPSPAVLSNEEQWVVVTLQAAENAILDARSLSIENFEVEIEYDDEGDEEGYQAAPTIWLQANVDQQYPHERTRLRCSKDHSDFDRLHEILRELNPRVCDIQPPRSAHAGEGPFREYLEALVALSVRRSWEAADHRVSSSPLEGYLEDLQATEVREQLLAFLEFAGHD